MEMTGISKAYPGVVALSDVDFSVARGEVRALLGKNGAGKSTLVKIIAGVERPDAGTILLDGKPVAFRSPADGIGAGIATVHQELSVIGEMSAAENIFLGRWPRRAGRVDWARMNREAGEALAGLGLGIDPRRSAGRLPMAERQLLEIARALSQGARLLILDEPTSSLMVHEVDRLVDVVRSVSEQGTAVIYISHRMDEIRRVATSVTVMRDGAQVGTDTIDVMPSSRVIELMLGSAAVGERAPPAQAATARRVVMSVHGLEVPPRIAAASFELRAGEVLGIAGVLGSGRTELLQALAGLRSMAGGEVTLEGKRYRPASLREAIGRGVFMTSEDRRGEGAVTMLGIDENLMMASWGAVSSHGVIDRTRMARHVASSVSMLGIKLARTDAPLAQLSGGNQQKVVIGKALNAKPEVLLLDEPTRGVDIGAKEQIYALMREVAASGMAVVFVSGELEEFPAICDRVLVLREGRIEAEITGDDIAAQHLLDLAMGDKEPSHGH